MSKNTAIVLQWAIIILATVLLYTARAHSAPPDHADPALAPWFHSLKQPNGIGCCDVSDCRIIEEDRWRYNDEGYEVLVDDKWIAIPKDRVLHKANPTGGAVLCMESTYKIIYCFVPGMGI